LSMHWRADLTSAVPHPRRISGRAETTQKLLCIRQNAECEHESEKAFLYSICADCSLAPREIDCT
jgi:hypothetical protein